MSNETSLFKYEKKKRDDARADKTIISDNVKEILTKISKVGYKELSIEEKSLIDNWVKKSPKIKWDFEAAKLTFTENRIVADWHERKVIRDANKKRQKEIYDSRNWFGKIKWKIMSTGFAQWGYDKFIR
jgi:hypothetical protein